MTASIGQIDVIGIRRAALVSTLYELSHTVPHPGHASTVGVRAHSARDEFGVLASSAQDILGVETGNGLGAEQLGVDDEGKSV